MSSTKEILWPCSDFGGTEKFDSGIIHSDPYVQGMAAIDWYQNNGSAWPPEETGQQPPFAPFTACNTTPWPPPRKGVVEYGCAAESDQLVILAGGIEIYGTYWLPWHLRTGQWMFHTTVTPTTSRPPPPNEDPSFFVDVNCQLGSGGAMSPPVNEWLYGNGPQSRDYVVAIQDTGLCLCPAPAAPGFTLSFIFNPTHYCLQAVDIHFWGEFTSDFPPGFIR